MASDRTNALLPVLLQLLALVLFSWSASLLTTLVVLAWTTDNTDAPEIVAIIAAVVAGVALLAGLSYMLKLYTDGGVWSARLTVLAMVVGAVSAVLCTLVSTSWADMFDECHLAPCSDAKRAMVASWFGLLSLLLALIASKKLRGAGGDEYSSLLG